MPEEDKERNAKEGTRPEKELGTITFEFCLGSAPEGANWDGIDCDVGNKTEAQVEKKKKMEKEKHKRSIGRNRKIL